MNRVLEQGATKVKPVVVGLSLSATVVVMYLVCALAVWVAPGTVESAITVVSHSLNLGPVFEQAPKITFVGVLEGTVAVAVYFFVTGTVFGWIYNRFAAAR